ncbi:MAG: exodeoxyribonuclease VII large subunit [Proteobacteria bacterium]|nr:exodeoxyribonuclease VII large subunit [Pseudomonadota bacterium]
MPELPPGANAKPYSVSELAFALKRTLEDAYGYVRLRGEVSKVTRHASGHVYLTLKDERACIDGVVWKAAVRGLKAQPQQGLEVIVTGRITTYPSGSRYQIVIETLEPAGVGALLAQLERLKVKLQGEGLFETGRKQRIPGMPLTVGVITSPTGAVIRDVLHRIRDRWPCRVVVWPVVVQGDAASGQVAAAVRGFNALGPGGGVPRPDVIIVARGGGSVEDLWPFNDEALARAVSAGAIPLISAVGHETDTTLIDFVSDLRAPTPTGAAEMATPVLAELKAAVSDLDRRMHRCGGHGVEKRRTQLLAASRGLPGRDALLGPARQRFDGAAGRLKAALARNAALHDRDLHGVAARLQPALLDRPRLLKAQRVSDLSARMDRAAARAGERAAAGARLPQLGARMEFALGRRLQAAGERLERLEQLRCSLNPDRPLELGFARVHRSDGALARSGAELEGGEAVRLHFKDGDRGAVIDGTPPPRPAARPRTSRPATSGQAELF